MSLASPRQKITSALLGENMPTITPQFFSAKGTVRAAPITLREIAIEGMVLHNVAASCCVTGEALLGMSALERLNFTIGSGWMSMALKN